MLIRIRYILVALTFLFFTAHALAQEKKIQKGDKLFDQYSYQEAIYVYEKIKPRTAEITRRLAESYRRLHKNAKSKKLYAELVHGNEAEAKDFLHYAELLKFEQNYDSAMFFMKKFAELDPKDIRAQLYMKDSLYYLPLLKNNKRFNLQNLDINTPHQEFGAVYSGNKIVFSSSRELPQPIQREWNWNGQPFLNIYESDSTAKGQLSEPRPLNNKFNIKYHQGPATFSHDGQQVIYTQNDNDKHKDGVTRFKMMQATVGEKGWLEITEFEHNGDSFSVGHPSLSVDGRTLYFSSDKPGGFGGADIYVCTKDDNGIWSKPRNLGYGVNTEGNEMFPYIHPSGALYFASDGRPGLGGLDLFVAQPEEKGFEESSNMGFPFNTSHEDFSIVMDSSSNSGYFASNRPGGKGSDDLYYFDLNIQQFFTCLNYPCVTLDLNVEGEFDEHLLLHYWDMGDGTIIPGTAVTHCYQKVGSYVAKLSVQDMLSGMRIDNIDSLVIDIDSTGGSFAAMRSVNEVYEDSIIVLDGTYTVTDFSKVIAYDWYLGDGTVIRDKEKVEHTFSEPGIYDLSLMTIFENADSSVCRDTAFKSIYVMPAPEVYDVNMDTAFVEYDIDLVDQDSIHFYTFTLNVRDKKNNKRVSKAQITVRDMEGNLWYRHYSDKEGKVNMMLDRNVEYEILARKKPIGDATLFHITDYKTEKQYSKDTVYLSPFTYSDLGQLAGGQFALSDPEMAARAFEAGLISLEVDKFESCLNYPCVTIDVRVEEEIRDFEMMYTWDMGDGVKVPGQLISHCYQNPGKYTVVLTVEDKLAGLREDSVEMVEVEIEEVGGSYADFLSENEIEAGTPVNFDASTTVCDDGKVLIYDWYLNDTLIRGNPQIEYAFDEPGIYDLAMAVIFMERDSTICRDTAYKSIYVWPPMVSLGDIKEDSLPPEVENFEDYQINLTDADSIHFYDLEMTFVSKDNGDTVKGAQISITDETGTLWYRRYSDSTGKVVVRLDRNIRYSIFSRKREVGSGRIDHITDARTEKQYEKAVLYLSWEHYERMLARNNKARDDWEGEKLVLSREQKRASLGIDLSDMIRFEPIYFAYNSYKLTPADKIALDKIVRFLNDNDDLVIEIGSHTDSRGQDDYNQKLSERRARSTASYIVDSGVSRRRISYKGYGEKVLLNECGNEGECTDEEHRVNRRTEFRIVSIL